MAVSSPLKRLTSVWAGRSETPPLFNLNLGPLFWALL